MTDREVDIEEVLAERAARLAAPKIPMHVEGWVPVEEFPQYLVSNYGRVMHENRQEPRQINMNKNGMAVISLMNNPDPTRYLRHVNQLVAKAYLPPPFYKNDTSVWHKDGDFMNCRADNLLWERRDRVLEWNRMHRLGEPSFGTPQVRNNRTGHVYKNAYECAMAEGVLESSIVWRIEKQALSIDDDRARYRYV